jgi:hypothetical protein
LYISKQLSQYLSKEGDDGLKLKSEYGTGTKIYFFLENK